MSQHVIQNAVIELSFGSEAQALEEQAGLGEFVQRRLMTVVERVLDEMSEPDRVLRIDRLDLDLGSVPYHGYQEEMEVRLEERLRDLLREKLGALQHHGSSHDALVTMTQAHQEHLNYYLRHGRLPWNAGLLPGQSVDQMMEQAVRYNPSDLLSFLRASAGTTTVIKRLVKQFPERLLAQIALTVAPSRAGFLTSLVEDFHNLWHLRHFMPGSEREFRSFLWEEIYHHMIESGHSLPDSQETIDQIITRLAGRSRLSRARLLDTLAETAGRLAEANPVGPELAHFIHVSAGTNAAGAREDGANSRTSPSGAGWSGAGEGEADSPTLDGGIQGSGTGKAGQSSYQESTGTAAAAAGEARSTLAPRPAEAEAIGSGVSGAFSPLASLGDTEGLGNTGQEHQGEATNNNAERGSTEIRVLQHRLEAALLNGNPQLVGGFWAVLLQDLPDLVREAFSQHCRPAPIRRRLASGFPEAMLLDLAGLFLPNARELLRGVFANVEALLPAVDTSAEGGGLPKARVWEFILACFLIAEEERPSTRDLVEDILCRVELLDEDTGHSPAEPVSRDPTTYPVPAGQAAGPDHPPLHLSGVLDRAASLKKDYDSASNALVRSYELYDLLRQVMSGRASGQDPVQLIDQLAEHSPWQLLRLFREMQSNRGAIYELSSGLSAEALGHFVNAVLSLPLPTAPAAPTELMQAIGAYAWQAQNPGEFYLQVLDCLLKERIIDLEAILCASQKLPEAAHIEAGATEEEAPADASPETTTFPVGAADPYDLMPSLVRYLREGGPLSSGDAARMVTAMEVLLARQPAPVRHLLEPVLEHPAASGRLIGLLPERLLTRLLAALQPADHYRAQRSADILADAFVDASRIHGLGITSERATRLKWEFLFRYLLEERLPFAARSFVGRFAEYLAGALGVEDFAEIRSLLAQRVTLNVLPCTREEHLSVIQALDQGSGKDTGLNRGDSVAQPTRPPPAHRSRSADLESGGVDGDQDINQGIYITNAGMVLAAPYMPRLFELLGLTEGRAFLDPGAAERGAHLLQFMVNESTVSPDYQLVLNKLLCGIPLDRPLERSVDITDGERETVESLIQGMVQNWKTIGNTSVAGFRESFLQREGRLMLHNDSWNLLVEQRAYDMLLDSLPWSFTTIRHPWMERIIYVDWR